MPPRVGREKANAAVDGPEGGRCGAGRTKELARGFLKLECHAGGGAPELEISERKARRIVAGAAEAAEIAHVAAQADVVREESHHAAADVHPEVVLRGRREQ